MPTYDRLSALDRSFLDMENRNTHMHVGAALRFQAGRLAGSDGTVNVERIRDYVAGRLHEIPRYRQRIEWIPLERHPVWVDDERFDIDYHIRHVRLPAPGNDARLKRLCGRVMSQQLDRGKPLWEIWIVEGLEGGGFALLCKTHHCMIDGASGMDLLQLLLSPVPVLEFAPAEPWEPRPRPDSATLVRDSILRRSLLPVMFANAAAWAMREPSQALDQATELAGGIMEAALAGIDRASDTPLNHEIGPHRRIDWLRFDLASVKRVKRRLGGTINDVVLAVVAGAMGAFLEHRGISLASRRDLDIRAFCPVSLRSATEHGTMGNRVSSMIAPLPVAEADPRRRLATVIAEVGHLKDAKQALGAQVLSSICDWTAPTLLSSTARLAFRRHVSSLVVTNIPGPQQPLYLLDARMTDSFPMVPLFTHQGLGIALFSYDGGLYWGFNADLDLVPDLTTFVEAADRSFAELVKAAGPPATKRQAARPGQRRRSSVA